MGLEGNPDGVLGTCEEGNPILQTQDNTSSYETHYDVVEGDADVRDQDQDQTQTQTQNTPSSEETAIVEKLKNLDLKPNGDIENIVKEDEEQQAEDEKEEVEKAAEVEVEIEEGEDEEGKIDSYPWRPDAPCCAFYIKTGTCKFGLNCRFNHPPKRVFKPVGEKEKSTEELNGVVPDTGKIECKYFSTPGGCKYGDACRFKHYHYYSEKTRMKEPELNFLGLPLRPMEKECTFYMRTGTCAYGANCRFNHPDPTAANEPEPGNSLANGYSLRSVNNLAEANELTQSSRASQGTFTNGMHSKNSLLYASKVGVYHHGMPQNAGWNQDQGTVPWSANKLPLPHQLVNMSKNADSLTHYERLMQIEEFPERPGQPDCDYFMKTGDCKYRSSCKYNHPISRSSRLRLPPLSSKGLHSTSAKVSPVELHNSCPGNTRKNGMHSASYHQLENEEFPERPGQPECEFFMKTGNCKFKSACRYHHPRNFLPTSSPPCSLNERGLPLRPGAKVCRNYEQQGTCHYGARCLFHHPDNLPAAAEDHDPHSSTNFSASNLNTPASNSASDWDDGWVM